MASQLTTRRVTTSVFPFLTVNNGAKAVEFYATAFGAIVPERYDLPDGKVMARLEINGAVFWTGDEEAEFGNHSPLKFGGSPVRIILTIDDPETVFAKALSAGATPICPVTIEESWKIGKLQDPFGHIWEIGHPL